jgi:gliding motility-associated-like protein
MQKLIPALLICFSYVLNAQNVSAPFLMGRDVFSTACEGVLFDSGGPDSTYQSNESSVFTVCPTAPTSCIEINVENYNIEDYRLFFGGDVLLIFEGNSTTGDPKSILSGAGTLSPFKVKVNSNCFTVFFQSDEKINFSGFKISWKCTQQMCNLEQTQIANLPFSSGLVSTCDKFSTTAISPCGFQGFLNGQESVFVYTSPGGVCADIQLTGALPGTGILITKGQPGLPQSTCVAQSEIGFLNSVDFRDPGNYYITVANGVVCTPFSLSIVQSDCFLSPALTNALCNPLNGCQDGSGQPQLVNYFAGSGDIDIQPGINSGCWPGPAFNPNYYWFSIEAAATGDLAFLLSSEGPLTDLDFNVWGPFSNDSICLNKTAIVNLIKTTAPIRSSWSPTKEFTGLSAVHPTTNVPVLDDFDCADLGSPANQVDGLARPIQAKQGEVYVVLINDSDNSVSKRGLKIDWTESSPEVIGKIIPQLQDTTICRGGSAQIKLNAPASNIQWVDPQNTLSCKDCPNPIARPNVTTTYKALIETICYQEEVEVTIHVFNLDLGPDFTTCLGDKRILNPNGSNAGTYNWVFPQGVQSSCTNCSSPEVTFNQPGTFIITATLFGTGCNFQDVITVTVLPEQAPVFSFIKNIATCKGETINLGGQNIEGVSFLWSSIPAGFASNLSNPSVSPTENTTYFVEITNNACPVTLKDSVRVEVSERPLLDVQSSVTICEGDQIVLGNTMPQNGVTYSWIGGENIRSPGLPNTIVSPDISSVYTISATRTGCTVSQSVNVNVTPSALQIQIGDPTKEKSDTMGICKGQNLPLSASVNPNGTPVIWNSTNGQFNNVVSDNIVLTGFGRTFTVYASSSNQQCSKMDSIVFLVDSLPANLLITPGDTTICEGDFVVLKTAPYQPADYPGLKFSWFPSRGQETPDSLLSMVLSPDTTNLYFRVATNGSCLDTSFALVTVNPLPILSIFPADTTVCPGEGVRLMLEVEQPGTLQEIMWMPENGLSCSDCRSPIATPLISTTYSVQAKLKDCPGDASARINVRPRPIYQLPTQRVICPGNSVLLNSIFSANVTYTWTSDDPNFGTITNPRPIVSPSKTTTYFLTIEDGICAPIKETVKIEVVGEVSLSVSTSNNRICQNESVTLTANITGGTSEDSFYWINDRGLVFQGKQITVFPPLTTTYTFFYTTGGDCQRLDQSLTIIVDPAVDVSIQAEPANLVVPQGTVVDLKAQIITMAIGSLSINWSSGSTNLGSSESISAQLINSPSEFIVKVTTPAGCMASDTIVFEVIKPTIQIPNAFTPNGDGQNDFFNVLFSGDIDEIIEFRVFNRWGRVVYNNQNPNIGWDGNLNGTPQPSEVYVYQVRVKLLDGEEVSLKGDVTLIR